LLCVIFLYALPYRVVYRVLKIQKVLLLIEASFLVIMLLVGTQIHFVNINSLLQLIILLGVFQVLSTEFASRKHIQHIKVNNIA